MDSAVVGPAEGEEIGDEVFPAFAAPLEMVRLRKDRVPATGDATFRTVSAQDRAPRCGRDGLGGAGGTRAQVGANVRVVSNAHVCASVRVVSNAHVCVHMPDVLSVALRHLDDFGTDLDELPASLLRGPATALANRERDLVARAPRVPIPRKGLPTEQQKSCVVVERAPPRHAESSPSLRDKSPKPRLTARGAAGGARAASPESPRA